MPKFTAQQLSAIKALVSDPANALYAAAWQTGNDEALAAALNALFSPNFYAWRTDCPVREINDAISWANLTPPTAGGVPNTAAYTNACLAAQGKQFNLQLLLPSGQAAVDATRANFRAGLQDALTQLPTANQLGNAASLQAAGWAAVQPVLSRPTRNIEKLFATGTGAQASPATMAFEGTVTADDMPAVRNAA